MPDPAWNRARAVAARQKGFLTRQQCLEAGLDDQRLHRAIRADGPWQRVLPGLYATFTGPLTSMHLAIAALLYSGPLAQLTGVTALALYGCTYLPNDPRVHLLLPAKVQRRGDARLRIHRTHRLPPPWHRDDLPLTPPDRAAVLAVAHLQNLREVRAVLSEVVQRRLTTVEHLDACLEAGPRHGRRLARSALDDLAAGCRSAPEMELRDLLRRCPHLLRGLEWNYRIDIGGTWFIADACWPHARLIVEVDSVAHHGLGEGPERTARRRAALTAAGWTVLSVSPLRIREEPDAILSEIEALLTRGWAHA